MARTGNFRFTRARLRLLVVVVTIFGLLAGAILWGNEGLRALEDSRPSRSEGSPSNGRLENGKRLPTSGRNFVAYSRLATLLGRNSVHSAVRDVVLDAYALLETSAPGWRFTYGETGWPGGGRFRPHRTHQNGMSADFMVPVRDASSGQPVGFPSSVMNKFGYGLEFDRLGTLETHRIDFEILARHLAALDVASKRHRLVITRVILAPEYLPLLWATETGRKLRQRLPFLETPAWIRHDEHFHVDFAVASR
jgi:penicillin-insensitive murein endopeptidase